MVAWCQTCSDSAKSLGVAKFLLQQFLIVKCSFSVHTVASKAMREERDLHVSLTLKRSAPACPCDSFLGTGSKRESDNFWVQMGMEYNNIFDYRLSDRDQTGLWNSCKQSPNQPHLLLAIWTLLLKHGGLGDPAGEVLPKEGRKAQ